MVEIPGQKTPSSTDDAGAFPHRWLHKSITGLEYDGGRPGARPDPPVPLWLKASLAKVVLDVVEDSRCEWEVYRPRVSVESLVRSSVAREALNWILGAERFELCAGQASLKRLGDGKKKTLICRNGQLYCWLETAQPKIMSCRRESSGTRNIARQEAKESARRAECIDLSTDALADALVTQSWDRDHFAPTKVRWDTRERLRYAFLRDEALMQAALQMEIALRLKKQTAALSREAIRMLRSSGVVPKILEEGQDVAVTPPPSVSAAAVYAACLEYRELWTGASERAVGSPDVAPSTGHSDVLEKLFADLEQRM